MLSLAVAIAPHRPDPEVMGFQIGHVYKVLSDESAETCYARSLTILLAPKRQTEHDLVFLDPASVAEALFEIEVAWAE